MKTPHGNRTHGHGKARTVNGKRKPSLTYIKWQQMKQRCFNPKNQRFKDYMGRGITVCERWLTFTNFLEDMGECPKGLTLERIDNDKGYSPDNCEWRTAKEQCRNRRSTVLNKDLVRKIRSMVPYYTSSQIGKALGITTKQAYDVIHFKCWRDIQ